MDLIFRNPYSKLYITYHLCQIKIKVLSHKIMELDNNKQLSHLIYLMSKYHRSLS